MHFIPYQRPGGNCRVETRHVHVLADARRHPHEKLQLPPRRRREEEGAKLQGLNGNTLTVRLQDTYLKTEP